MININKNITEDIEKILRIICLEKGLTKNTEIAYRKDIYLIFDWFKKNNIDAISAKENNFRELFCFLQYKNYKPSSLNRKLSSLKQFYEYLS